MKKYRMWFEGHEMFVDVPDDTDLSEVHRMYLEFLETINEDYDTGYKQVDS